MDNNRSVQSNLGRIQVSFVEFAKGLTSPPYHTSTACRMLVKDIPEREVTVEQEGGGPPTDPPVNIVKRDGDDFDANAKVATDLYNYLDTNRWRIENLAHGHWPQQPWSVNWSWQRTRWPGKQCSGMAIGTALFGREVSKLKSGEDEYKIQLRYDCQSNAMIFKTSSIRITFRDF